MSSQREIQIWFFIGLSLLVNGALILGAGVYEFARPPQNPVVLFHLHANIWWGAILFMIGVAYSCRYAPSSANQQAATHAVTHSEGIYDK